MHTHNATVNIFWPIIEWRISIMVNSWPTCGKIWCQIFNIIGMESSLKCVDRKFHMQLNSISLHTQDTSPQRLSSYTPTLATVYDLLIDYLEWTACDCCYKSRQVTRVQFKVHFSWKWDSWSAVHSLCDERSGQVTDIAWAVKQSALSKEIA